jgi:hypothetical protein
MALTLSWRYFGGASILAAGLLLKFGAPVSAVLLGIASAAAANWSMQRSHVVRKTRSR